MAFKALLEDVTAKWQSGLKGCFTFLGKELPARCWSKIAKSCLDLDPVVLSALIVYHPCKYITVRFLTLKQISVQAQILGNLRLHVRMELFGFWMLKLGT